LVCACLAALPRAPEHRRRPHAVHTTQIFDFNTTRRCRRARAPTSARDEWDAERVQTLTPTQLLVFFCFFFSSHRATTTLHLFPMRQAPMGREGAHIHHTPFFYKHDPATVRHPRARQLPLNQAALDCGCNPSLVDFFCGRICGHVFLKLTKPHTRATPSPHPRVFHCLAPSARRC
jgi:hypothetical protein